MDAVLVEKQHKKGKLYVEERLQLLFDDQRYTELTTPEDRDGVYVCEGRVMGKRVVAIDKGRIVRDSRGGEYGFDD